VTEKGIRRRACPRAEWRGDCPFLAQDRDRASNLIALALMILLGAKVVRSAA